MYVKKNIASCCLSTLHTQRIQSLDLVKSIIFTGKNVKTQILLLHNIMVHHSSLVGDRLRWLLCLLAAVYVMEDIASYTSCSTYYLRSQL